MCPTTMAASMSTGCRHSAKWDRSDHIERGSSRNAAEFAFSMFLRDIFAAGHRSTSRTPNGRPENMATSHHKPGKKPANGADKWAKTWTINDTDSDALSNVLLVKNGITRFTLVPAKINDEVVGYEVKYTAGEMARWACRRQTSSIRCRSRCRCSLGTRVIHGTISK